MITAKPLRGYWTLREKRRRNWNNEWKSNEVVARIREKYQVAGPRLARPGRPPLLDHSQQDICIACEMLPLLSINRNENPRFALSDRNNVTPLAVKLTVVDLLPGSRNVTARELSYRSTLTYRHESQLLPNDCIFIATRAFLSLSLVKTRKLERGRGIGIAVCESNFNYTSGGLWLGEKSNEAYFIDSSLCRALLRKKMRGGERNA